ncbi:MAG: winged helix-turn-helix transcriptional regulator [Candidatus Latescibacteria bacterium]|nr:winged helix-turn-helix transcriptional regulator [Candidatus Latescibacterota bacterium]
MVRSAFSLIPKNSLEQKVQRLKAISHPIRLQIVNILIKGESTVNNLVEKLGTHQSLMSQQLNILKISRILRSRREGNKVFYFIANENVKKLMLSVIKEI